MPEALRSAYIRKWGAVEATGRHIMLRLQSDHLFIFLNFLILFSDFEYY